MGFRRSRHEKFDTEKFKRGLTEEEKRELDEYGKSIIVDGMTCRELVAAIESGQHAYSINLPVPYAQFKKDVEAGKYD